MNLSADGMRVTADADGGNVKLSVRMEEPLPDDTLSTFEVELGQGFGRALYYVGLVDGSGLSAGSFSEMAGAVFMPKHSPSRHEPRAPVRQSTSPALFTAGRGDWQTRTTSMRAAQPRNERSTGGRRRI